MSGGADTPSVVLLLAGAAVLVGVTLTTGWSAVGAAVVGSFVLLFGLASVVPSVVLWAASVTRPLGNDLSDGASTALAVGFVAVVGTVLVAASASSAVARRQNS